MFYIIFNYLSNEDDFQIYLSFNEVSLKRYVPTVYELSLVTIIESLGIRDENVISVACAQCRIGRYKQS